MFMYVYVSFRRPASELTHVGHANSTPACELNMNSWELWEREEGEGKSVGVGK